MTDFGNLYTILVDHNKHLHSIVSTKKPHAKVDQTTMNL
jgi:hypothetical protein